MRCGAVGVRGVTEFGYEEWRSWSSSCCAVVVRAMADMVSCDLVGDSAVTDFGLKVWRSCGLSYGEVGVRAVAVLALELELWYVWAVAKLRFRLCAIEFVFELWRSWCSGCGGVRFELWRSCCSSTGVVGVRAVAQFGYEMRRFCGSGCGGVRVCGVAGFGYEVWRGSGSSCGRVGV